MSKHLTMQLKKWYTCVQCGKHLSSYHSLWRHKKNCHSTGTQQHEVPYVGQKRSRSSDRDELCKSSSQRSELPKRSKIQTLVNEINNDKAESLSSIVSPEVTLDVIEAVPSEFEPLQEVVLDINKTEACNDEITGVDINKRSDNKYNDEKIERIKRVYKEKIESTIKHTIDSLDIHERGELKRLIEGFKENDDCIDVVLKVEKLVEEFPKGEGNKLKIDEFVKELESSSILKDKITKLKTLLNVIYNKQYRGYFTLFLFARGLLHVTSRHIRQAGKCKNTAHQKSLPEMRKHTKRLK